MSAVAILSYIKEGRMGSRAKKPLIQSPTLDLIKDKLHSGSRIIILALFALLFLVIGLWEVALIIIFAAAAWHYGRNQVSRHHIEKVAFACVIAAAIHCFGHFGNNSGLHYYKRVTSNVMAIPDPTTH